MKKLVLLLGIVVFSMNAFAQKAGEKYVAPCFSASFGFSNYKYYHNNWSYEDPEWSNVNVSTSVEFGKFVTDKLRFGFDIGQSFTYIMDDEAMMWGAMLSPNLGLHLPITDCFYYAPEIGIGGELGFYLDERYVQALAYTNLLVFDFKVKENISIAMYMGEIGYCFSKVVAESSGYGNIHQFYYYFNTGKISARFFF